MLSHPSCSRQSPCSLSHSVYARDLGTFETFLPVFPESGKLCQFCLAWLGALHHIRQLSTGGEKKSKRTVRFWTVLRQDETSEAEIVTGFGNPMVRSHREKRPARGFSFLRAAASSSSSSFMADLRLLLMPLRLSFLFG